MKKTTIAVVVVMSVGTGAAGEGSATAQECNSRVMAAATEILRASDAIQVRGLASTGKFRGYFTGVTCQELVFWSEDKSLSEASRRFRWSDVKNLEVGRQRSAGWKGALIGVTIGAGLGAVLRPREDDAARGAVLGALVFGAAGLTWPVTEWRPVDLPKDALGE